MNTEEKKWWKEAIVYQIYPRSYMDSNGDGIGDLKGIITKLDYISSLGINVVWLNPIYCSPNDDNGYDISDYRRIMCEFGTMNDFDTLIAGLHSRGIKLIMDLVVNHCSDEHFWFKESRKSRDNKYRDYFHWLPAENGTPAKRWSFFDPDENAWEYDEATNAYYLHYFSKKQPDLNWENPNLRQEIYDMMHYWFKKGIDGFRMDVITFISKDVNFPEMPDHFNGRWDHFYASGPKLHDYLQEMNKEVLTKYDIMTVAEGPGTTPENVLDLVAEERKELSMSYHFDHTELGILSDKLVTKDYKDLVEFKKIHTKWDATFKEKGWGTVYLGNHDQPRMVSRWADDSPKWRVLSAKLLNTWLLSMRGTPYLYQGDEIGMTNIKFDNIEDYRDIETINIFNRIKKQGGDIRRFMESQKIIARDNSRTPMQWDSSRHAGFSSTTPWINVNPNYKKVNVTDQENDPDSVLQYFRKMVRLRTNHEVLIYGSYQLLYPEHTSIYAYLRQWDDITFLVVLNFSGDSTTMPWTDGWQVNTVMINNYSDWVMHEEKLHLKPYQAIIFKLE